MCGGLFLLWKRICVDIGFINYHALQKFFSFCSVVFVQTDENGGRSHPV